MQFLAWGKIDKQAANKKLQELHNQNLEIKVVHQI